MTESSQTVVTNERKFGTRVCIIKLNSLTKFQHTYKRTDKWRAKSIDFIEEISKNAFLEKIYIDETIIFFLFYFKHNYILIK